ncbi:hypothetical protein ACTFIR_004171 [Dictyostelium discoideum]
MEGDRERYRIRERVIEREMERKRERKIEIERKREINLEIERKRKREIEIKRDKKRNEEILEINSKDSIEIQLETQQMTRDPPPCRYPSVNVISELCVKEGCNNLTNVINGFCYHHCDFPSIEQCLHSYVMPPSHTNVLVHKRSKCSIADFNCIMNHGRILSNELVEIDDACYKYLFADFHCPLGRINCEIDHKMFNPPHENEDLCEYISGIEKKTKCEQSRPCKMHPNFNKYSYRFPNGNFYKDPKIAELTGIRRFEQMEIQDACGLSGDSLISLGIFSISVENLFKIQQTNRPLFQKITNYTSIPNLYKIGLKFGKIERIQQFTVDESQLTTITTLDLYSIVRGDMLSITPVSDGKTETDSNFYNWFLTLLSQAN